MTPITLLIFIKFTYAGTGTARDINTLIIFIVLFLVFLLAITYLVSAVRRNLLNRLRNRKGELDDILKDKDYKIYDDFDYF